MVARPPLEIGRASITVMCEGNKVTSSRARMRDAVATLLALLRPTHAGVIERMIAEDHLVPDAPLTFEFMRLFRQLRDVLERWQDEFDPEVVVVQRRSVEILGHVHPILMKPSLLDETMVLRDMQSFDVDKFPTAVKNSDLNDDCRNDIISSHDREIARLTVILSDATGPGD